MRARFLETPGAKPVASGYQRNFTRVLAREQWSKNRVLRKLAEPTGGRAFQVDKRNTLDKIFAAIQEEMRNQYAIGFKSADEMWDGSFRKLAVKAKKSGMKITMRNGYFAIRK